MKTLLLTLTMLAGTVYASDKHYVKPGTEGTIIGEVTQEVTVIGRSEKDWLHGCNTQGFHVAAYIQRDGTGKVITYCGPGNPEVKKFNIIVEEGI